MKRIILMMVAILAIGGINAQSLSKVATSAAAGGDLVKDLMKSAQVNEKQAMGGAGALFDMAQENLSKEDFEAVGKAVPEMDKMLDAAPAVGGKSSMLSTTATALTGMPKVQAAFKKLGISEDKVALFTPVIVNYVEKNGSKLLGSKLSKAFGM